MSRIYELKAVVLSCAILIATQFNTPVENPPITEAEVAPVKRTPQSLYLTSQGAFDMLKAQPDILFVDVRDPIEIAISGHPKPIDAIVPIMVHSEIFDERLGEYKLVENVSFLEDMNALLAEMGVSPEDNIIITCGSGWRSAKAAHALFEAGFTNVWHIIDGYPGETKPGINSQNAWKVAGLPWTTTADVWGSAWRMSIESKDHSQL